ncbi:MAG TPA: sulfotransferase [Melioribacteraceae bacterium]|nr:sulfotransferase [Melioribacteraceae bacterium]
MIIKNPVIIIGAERSGTTLLYSLLSNHKDFYWFSQLDSIFPNSPYFTSYLRRFVHLFGKGKFISKKGTISKSKGFNTPTECIPYWRNIFGFGTEANYRIEDDCFDHNFASSSQVEAINNDIALRMRILKKSRLLLKQPGFSLKTKYFNSLFSKPLFVVIYRNFNDNLISMVNAKKASKEKFWGTKIPGWRNYLNHSHIEQGLIQISTVYRSIKEDLELIDPESERTLYVKYEELLENPHDKLFSILKFCKMDEDPVFNYGSDFYEGISLKRTGYKIDLTEKQIEIIKVTERLFNK